MSRQKHPDADLRIGYRKRIELALALILALSVVAFYSARHLDYGPQKDLGDVNIVIEVADIPQTEQIHRPPPPPRPVVPVPSESEDIPDDLTIESTELDLTELPPPPPPKVEDDIEGGFVFVPYDEAPEMIGGNAALLKYLVYPELARKAGIQGTVMIGALIGTDGRVIKTTVLKSSGTNIGFEEAAMNAVMKTKWRPAKQRDRKVKVWMAIPVRFKLRGDGASG